MMHRPATPALLPTAPRSPTTIHLGLRAPTRAVSAQRAPELQLASRLRGFLDDVDAGRARLSDLAQLTRDPRNLRGARPLDVQNALKRIAREVIRDDAAGDISNASLGTAASAATAEEEHQKTWPDDSILALLRSLDAKGRGDVVRLMNGTVDDHSIERLISEVMVDDDKAALARELVAHGPTPQRSGDYYVYSDVDDTVRPWKDTSCKAGVYPGARALYQMLAPHGDIHFVTARDGFLVSAREPLRKTKLPYASVAYGNLGSAFAFFGMTGPLVAKKLENLRKLIERNPKGKCAVLGDSGQADDEVFKQLLVTNDADVALVLMHEIPGFPANAELAKHPKTIVFKTYPELAEKLAQRGVLTTEQARLVASSAQRDMAPASAPSSPRPAPLPSPPRSPSESDDEYLDALEAID